MMKNLFLALSVWLSLCCAGSGVAQAQGTYFQGAMVPSPAPFIGFAMLGKSGNPASVTGTLTETTLATVTIPPNTLGANGQLKVTTFWAVTNSANSKTLKIKLGTTAISSTTASTVANVQGLTTMLNANATNSQSSFTEIARGTDGLVTTVALTGLTLDMTQSQTLTITGTLASSGETITLLGYTIEVAN